MKICDFFVGIVVLRSISFVMHAAERFQAQRERGHVEQHDVANFAGEHAGLNGRADRDDFVRD